MDGRILETEIKNVSKRLISDEKLRKNQGHTKSTLKITDMALSFEYEKSKTNILKNLHPLFKMELTDLSLRRSQPLF